jgi:hypothetical protein
VAFLKSEKIENRLFPIGTLRPSLAFCMSGASVARSADDTRVGTSFIQKRATRNVKMNFGQKIQLVSYIEKVTGQNAGKMQDNDEMKI